MAERAEWKTFSQALCRRSHTHHHTYKVCQHTSLSPSAIVLNNPCCPDEWWQVTGWKPASTPLQLKSLSPAFHSVLFNIRHRCTTQRVMCKRGGEAEMKEQRVAHEWWAPLGVTVAIWSEVFVGMLFETQKMWRFRITLFDYFKKSKF